MYVIKLLAFFLLLSSIIFCLLNLLYRRTNHNRNFFENTEKFRNGVPKALEITCTGSSYAKFGIDFSKSEYRGFNFAVFPQSLNYDYKILKQYRKHLKRGGVVLITLAPLVFGFVDYENDVSNYKYYKFLHKKYINNYSFATKITHIIFPLLATPRLIKYIFHDVACNRYDEPVTSEEHCKKEAMNRMRGWCEQFRIKDLKEAVLTEEMKLNFNRTSDILRRMIVFCFEKELTPVIVIPPVSKALYEMFSIEFLEAYLYNNIRRCNHNITVLNYIDNIELGDYRYYSNSDFMNKSGREKFTNVLIKDLETKNLLSRNNTL